MRGEKGKEGRWSASRGCSGDRVRSCYASESEWRNGDSSAAACENDEDTEGPEERTEERRAPLAARFHAASLVETSRKTRHARRHPTGHGRPKPGPRVPGLRTMDSGPYPRLALMLIGFLFRERRITSFHLP